MSLLGNPAAQEGNASFAEFFHQFRILPVLPDIGHAGNLQAEVAKIDGSFQSNVLPDAEYSRPARQKTPRAGQPVGTSHLHHSRPFVVFEEQRAFHAARSHHYTLCSDFEVPFRKAMVQAAFLKAGDQSVAVNADGGGIGKNPDVFRPLDRFGQRPRATIVREASLGLSHPVFKDSAQPRSGFQKDHPKALLGGFQGGRHACKPSPDDANLRSRGDLVKKSFHPEVRGKATQAGQFADLVDRLGPDPGRTMKHSIIEAGGHGPAQPVQEAHEVKFGAALDVLRRDGDAFGQKGRFGPDIRNTIHLHHGVGTFAIQAVEPSRAVIFQASPKDPDPVGEKSGSHGIAFNTSQGPVAVGERAGNAGLNPQRRQIRQS